MAARKIKDIAVKTGEYQSQGQTKGRWLNVGSLMKADDGGVFIILDRTFNPAGVPNPDNRSNVMLSCFDLKGDRQEQPRQQPQSGGYGGMDDEIPFAPQVLG